MSHRARREGDVEETRRTMDRCLGAGNGSEWPEEWTPFSDWGKGERESAEVKLERMPHFQAKSDAESEGGVQETAEGWD